jgi:HD-GYP domain-containing protein (c-di-GMP phosphodiesterase class II)
MVLYREQAYPFSLHDLERLRSQGVQQLYIRLVDAESYHRYLHEQVLGARDVPAATRVAAVREATRAAFRDASRASDNDKLVAIAQDLGQQFGSIVSNDNVVLTDLFRILDHDFYTFTHVCNVSVYCLLLAQKIGIRDPGVLKEIAAGAILHDIGKRAIASAILNKSGRPTEEEWAIIRVHPTVGYSDLHQRTDVTWAQLMMVYQHHEHLDGSGYPVQILREEIHPWAKICAVADVFDALSSHRPYRKALSTHHAFEHLQRRNGEWFEPDLINAWGDCVKGLV